MSAELRWEQCCESDGCKRAARFGTLCAACFYAASPARRAVELLAGTTPEAASAPEFVSDDGAKWLAQLWAA